MILFRPLCAILFSTAALEAVIAVNWGGNYVAADIETSLVSPSGEIPFSLDTARSPEVGADYDGTSALFYGGLVSRGTSPADLWAVDQMDSPGDSLRFRMPEPVAGDRAIGVYLWKREDFLPGAEGATQLAGTEALTFEGRRYGSSILSQLRFVVARAGGEFLISDSLGPVPSDWAPVVLGDPNSVDWYAYDPGSDLEAIGAVIASPAFDQIEAVGVYLLAERGESGGSITIALSAFRVNLGDGAGEVESYLDHIDPGHFSALAAPGADRTLAYTPYAETGDRLLDFSHCGYGGGGQAIPNVPVVVTIDGPVNGDNWTIIQRAIQTAALEPPDENGIRGAVLLKAGTYPVSNPLRITTSGVVLRGEGDDPTVGTVLVATRRNQHALIEIGSSVGHSANLAASVEITDDHVPSGSYRVTVADASGFAPGDTVIVRRRSTAEWISEIGMDQIPPRPDGGTIVQWEAGNYDLLFDRVIRGIDGNVLILDAPIANPIQAAYGGGYVYPYTYPSRIEQVGVEHLRGVSEYDPAVTEFSSTAGKTVFTDENHGWSLVQVNGAQNIWIDGVSAQHFGYACVDLLDNAKWVTVRNCTFTEPVSQITGSRRYPFQISGQLCLVMNCRAEEGRHDFVINGGQTAGPNAFVDCHSRKSYATSEPHQRWSVGCLWDNVTVEGPDGWLMAANRGNAGSGHGWSGAQMVFWNCRAAIIAVTRPPTAQNFAIGAGFPPVNNPSVAQRAVNLVKGYGGPDLPVSTPLWGDGYLESTDRMVYPRSLYLKQLDDRLGAANTGAGFGGWMHTTGIPMTMRTENADPDGDGLSNLMEYFLGGDPLRADAESLFAVIPGENGETAQVFYQRAATAIDVFGTIEYSADLQIWTAADVTSVVLDESHPERYQCVVDLPSGVAEPRFLRLVVSR